MQFLESVMEVILNYSGYLLILVTHFVLKRIHVIEK